MTTCRVDVLTLVSTDFPRLQQVPMKPWDPQYLPEQGVDGSVAPPKGYVSLALVILPHRVFKEKAEVCGLVENLYF